MIPGWEDPLEKEIATHCSTLAWKIPWKEEPGRLQSMGSKSDTTKQLTLRWKKEMVRGKKRRELVNTYDRDRVNGQSR